MKKPPINPGKTRVTSEERLQCAISRALARVESRLADGVTELAWLLRHESDEPLSLIDLKFIVDKMDGFRAMGISPPIGYKEEYESVYRKAKRLWQAAERQERYHCYHEKPVAQPGKICFLYVDGITKPYKPGVTILEADIIHQSGVEFSDLRAKKDFADAVNRGFNSANHLISHKRMEMKKKESQRLHSGMRVKEHCVGGRYRGSSVGLPAALLRISSLLELPAPNVMVTGDIDDYGNVQPVDIEALKAKLKIPSNFPSEDSSVHDAKTKQPRLILVPEKNFRQLPEDLRAQVVGVSSLEDAAVAVLGKEELLDAISHLSRRRGKGGRWWTRVLISFGLVAVLAMVISVIAIILSTQNKSLPPTPATAQDKGVSMGRGNIARTGVYDSPRLNEPCSLLWRYNSESHISAAPTIYKGSVYFGDEDGRIHAVDAGPGKRKWVFQTSGSIHTSPAVMGNMVYVGSDDGYLYAIDRETGAKRWAFKTKGKVVSSPAIANNMVYFGSTDKHVYALDAQTGRKKWEYPTVDEVVCSPALQRDSLYIGDNEAFLYRIDAWTGVLDWHSQYPYSDRINSVAVSGGLIFFGNGSNCMYAIHDSSNQKWVYSTREGYFKIVGDLAVGFDGIFFSTTAGPWVITVDISTGQEIARQCIGNPVEESDPASSPAIAFQQGLPEVVYAADKEVGNLYRLDSSGAIIQIKAGTGITTSPVIDGGTVYFGCQDGTLRAYR